MKGGSLQNDTEVENPSGNHERQAPTQEICKDRRRQSAEEGAGGQDGDDCRLLRARDGKVASRRIRVSGAKLVLPVALSHH